MLPYTTRNDVLTSAEGEQNALCIYDYFVNDQGWTPQAVCGMLGNMWYESQCNPGRWQGSIYGNMSGGYGIVQWTPATKYIYWATDNDYDITGMEGQVARIVNEKSRGIQFSPSTLYPITFGAFSESTRDPGYLAECFVANYERPASYLNRNKSPEHWEKWVKTRTQRHNKANYFYELFTGLEIPDPDKPKGKRTLDIMQIIIYKTRKR